MRTLSLLPVAVFAACRATPPEPEARRHPNVVVILADDLGWGELGCYGQSRIQTPNLDRLAAQGVRFTQAYAGAPVCAPSRNVLLTGRHLGHVAIRGNKPARNATGEIVEGQHAIPAEAVTMAEVFREMGYATGAFGKWGLGPVGSTGDPNAQGFDRFYGYNCQRVAHSYYPPHLWSDAEQIAINAQPIPGHARQPEGDVVAEDWRAGAYAPDLILAEALRFVDDHADRPFLLYCPFVEPHVAMQPPAAWVESYPSSWDDRPYRGQCGYTPHPRPRAGYAAMISDLDEHVGAILAKLEEHGLIDDTIVVFTSDNGTTHRSGGDPVFGVGGVDADFFASTAGLRGFKGSVFEGGLRVPLLVRWPGRVPAGETSSQPVHAADLLPTLCEAAAIAAPIAIDGVSLWDTWTDTSAETARPPMVWTFVEYGGQVAVRDGRWKVVRQGLRRDGDPDPWLVFDLEVDPGEMVDLAAVQPAVVERAKEILRSEMADNAIFPLKVEGL